MESLLCNSLNVYSAPSTIRVVNGNARLTPQQWIPFFVHAYRGQIFKVLSNKPVYVTGKFSSTNGAKAVKCALGANEGYLYPLNKVRVCVHIENLLRCV